MHTQYVVEIGGLLYGTFTDERTALQWANATFPQRSMLNDPVRVLRPATVLTPGEQQERACFPNGR
jgi:hypothetical protein